MKVSLRLAGALIFAVGLCALAARPFYFDQLLSFVEKDIVAIDYDTPAQGRRELQRTISVIAITTSLLGLALLACANAPLRRRVWRTILSDRVCPSDSTAARPALLLFVSATGAILISFLLVFRTPLSLTGLYETPSGLFGEGPIPMVSAFFFLAAALIQGSTAWSLRRRNSGWPETTRKLVFWIYAGAAALFFVVGMEELSWGQWLYGWQTPEPFARLNTQRETNLHNLAAVDPYILLAVPALAMALFMSVIVSSVISARPPNILHFVLPPPSQVVLVSLILVSAFLPHTRFGIDELVEELGSLLTLMYAVRSAAVSRYAWTQASSRD